mmetsp:Transcript_26048/g.48549  ORF Transcript_26048/g.48549 Transcript_26048/m.48549 type:complete len:210 (-) Transcript_26048:119-748(-)
MTYESMTDATDHKKPRISCISRYQAPVQAFLRPAAWIPGHRDIRYYAERWTVQSTPKNALLLFVDTIKQFQEGSEGLMGKEKVSIAKTDKDNHYVQVYCFTAKAEWLDIVEIQFEDDDKKGERESAYQESEGSATCRATIRSLATGFIPTIVPFSPLCSVIFCWIPFAGNDPEFGLAANARVKQVRENMQKSVDISVLEETSCCSCSTL